MECVRSTRDLRRLVHACVLACVWQGLDGMWQAWTGFDFIMGYAPNAGRLTGSLGDYSVGNYMALAMIPCLCLLVPAASSSGRPVRGDRLGGALHPGLFPAGRRFQPQRHPGRGLRLRVLGPAGGRQDGTHRPLGLRPGAGGLHPAVLPPHGSVHHRGGPGAGASGPWAGRSSSSIPGWGRGLTATTPASGPWGSSRPMTPSPSATRTTCIWISCMPTASSASSWA